MSASRRHAFGTLLLFAVLLAACSPVTAPPHPDAAAIPDLIDQLCGYDWQIANHASEELARSGPVAAPILVQEMVSPTLSSKAKVPCNPMLQRALADMPADGAIALQAQLGPESPLDLPKQIGLVPPLLQMGEPGVQAIRALATGDDSQRPGSPLAISLLPLLDPDAADQLLAIAQKPAASAEEIKAALIALAWFGESTLPAQQTLLGQLEENEQINVIADTLRKKQPQASPLMISVASDSKAPENVRMAAVAALADPTAEPTRVVETMIGLLANKSTTSSLRRTVLDTLGRHGDAAAAASSVLLEEIRDPMAELAPETITALGEIGTGVPDVVDRLLELSQSCAPAAVVASAAQVLGTTTGTTEATQEFVLSTLTSLLACDDPDVQSAALVALGYRGVPALPTLLSFLTSTAPDTFVEPLTTAFATIGEDAVPGLVALLANPATTGEARTVITESLHIMAQRGQRALPPLVDAVQQGSTETRQRLVEGLYAIGPEALGLLLWLDQADPGVQFDTQTMEDIFGAVRLDPNSGDIIYQAGAVPAALPLLLESAQVTSSTPTADNVQAVRLIGLTGISAAMAAPLLAQLLEETNDLQFRCEIAVAVQRIGQGAGATAPALATALGKAKTTDNCKVGPKQRQQVSSPINLIQALTALGPNASPAVAQLIAALATPELRRLAAEALAAVGAAAHPALLHVLQHEEDADVRRAAAYALLKSDSINGVTAAMLEKMLTEAETDKADQQVRAMMATALLTHKYALPNTMVPLPMPVPLLRNCLDSSQLTQANLRLNGYDVYRDACVYVRPGGAPDWREVVAWLNSRFR